ncbi:MAG: hypothetical protein VKK62_06615 [Synechococcaceae cyanobacterium]|nr:hypothetical protein [Synechococcaceae cyanobacterium]
MDYLQIFGSTTRCSQILGISQSSCSRRYRLFSSEYRLDIGRQNGDYSACSNRDILDSLRQTAQKLRFRNGAFRLVTFWPCGSLADHLPPLFPRARPVPVAPMGIFTLLNLLDQRLIDVVIGGLMELQPLLPQPLHELSCRPAALTSTTHCLPLCTWELQLMAQRDHPLTALSRLSPDALQNYPSPALNLGDGPRLMQQLSRHGLGTRPYRLPQHELPHWEAASRDGHSLSYAAPHQLDHLRDAYDLSPLPYRLEIQETLALIAPAEAIGTAAIGPALVQALRQHPQAGHPGLRWLDEAEGST